MDIRKRVLGGAVLAGVVGVVAFAGVAGAAGKPGVSFVSPKSGATTSSTVAIKVKLSGFKIDASMVGMKAKAGVGHLHFSVDGGKFDHPKYSGANGALAVKLHVDGKYSPSVTPSITYKHLPKGSHTVKVWLANNDHSPEGASATIKITVK